MELIEVSDDWRHGTARRTEFRRTSISLADDRQRRPVVHPKLTGHKSPRPTNVLNSGNADRRDCGMSELRAAASKPMAKPCFHPFAVDLHNEHADLRAVTIFSFDTESDVRSRQHRRFGQRPIGPLRPDELLRNSSGACRESKKGRQQSSAGNVPIHRKPPPSMMIIVTT